VTVPLTYKFVCKCRARAMTHLLGLLAQPHLPLDHARRDLFTTNTPNSTPFFGSPFEYSREVTPSNIS
jgi:hypothetical protein